MPEKQEAEDYKETLNKGFLLAAVHIIFFGVMAVNLLMILKGKSTDAVDPKTWIYVTASVISVGAISFFTIIFKDGNFIKNTVSLLCSALNVFLLPMAMYASTGDSTFTFYYAILFQMAMIAMSRLEGVLLIGISGCLLLYQSAWFLGEGVAPSPKMFMAYCLVFFVALIWRLLVKHLFMAFSALAEKQKGTVSEVSSEQVQALQNERDVLRTELVQHVVEMKKFMSEQNVEEKSRES